MTDKEFLQKIDALWKEYDVDNMPSSQRPYLEGDLLDLLIEYKGGDE